MADANRAQDRERFPSALIEPLLELLEDHTDAALTAVTRVEEHNNDLAELHFDHGGTLILKRGRYDWVAVRFEASRNASRLLRRRTNVVAPAHLSLPRELRRVPVQAYWRIPLPTLEALWPTLSRDARLDALYDWGRLLRRVHRVRLDGCGPLRGERGAADELEGFLRRDLLDRLLPAVTAVWPDARPSVERLADAVPAAAAAAGNRTMRLVHADLHTGNVLCERDGDRARCVGLLDLESAMAGPAEADLASVAVLHGRYFGKPLQGPWLERLHRGYGSEPDPMLLAFFRAYHLVNMGFYSALIERDRHARQVARLARDAVRRLGSHVLAGA